MNIQDNSRYHEVHARSLADPEGFWGEAAREIDWIEPARKIFDPSMGPYGRWFAGGVVNTCYNALDRHVAGGRADQVALIHDSPLAGRVTKLTYAEMLNEVKTLAAVMADFGVAKGDRVILYMPMVPEAVVAMLACARIGAVHSVVFGGFAAKELATRIEDLFCRFDPVDFARGLAPKAFGVGERAGMDLMIPAVVLDVHGVSLLDAGDNHFIRIVTGSSIISRADLISREDLACS